MEVNGQLHVPATLSWDTLGGSHSRFGQNFEEKISALGRNRIPIPWSPSPQPTYYTYQLSRDDSGVHTQTDKQDIKRKIRKEVFLRYLIRTYLLQFH
jgi:hypothetical protein